MKNVALYVAIALMCLLILYSFVDMQTKSLEGMSAIQQDSSTPGDRQSRNGGRQSKNGGRQSKNGGRSSTRINVPKVPNVERYAMPDVSIPQFNDTRSSRRINVPKVPNVERYAMPDVSIPQLSSNTPYVEETINQDYNQPPSLQDGPVPVPARIESTIKPVLSNSDLEFEPYVPYIKTTGETSFSANPVYGPKKKGIKKVLANSVPKEYKDYSYMEKNPLYLSTVNSANISVLKRQFDDVLAFKSNLEKTNERIDSIKTRIDDIAGGMSLNSNKI